VSVCVCVCASDGCLPGWQVPPGTNGAVSVVGTLASAAGGLTVGLAAALFQGSQCERESAVALVGVGLFAGVFGSLVRRDHLCRAQLAS
jgi:uncharacterized membrane protein